MSNYITDADYKVVEESNKTVLENKVWGLLLEGYTLSGGVTINTQNRQTYCQALYKIVRKGDKQ